MKLLVISERIDQEDDDLAFHVLWIKEFIRQGFDVEVVCLQKGVVDGSFPVHSLGKEDGVGRVGRVVRLLRLVTTLKYDRVFVLMNAQYFTVCGWWWALMRIPSYMWYTHYSMHIHLRIAARVCKRMFAATAQSLPQYEGNPKKVVLGHGIDTDFWLKDYAESRDRNEKNILVVHRICRSKRLELAIQALQFLPQDYTLDVYGRDIDKVYCAGLESLAQEIGVSNRVSFRGPVPMARLKMIYPKYRILLNMASETIDKTMLEAMLFGVYPITTAGNSNAIGLPVGLAGETPEDIATFILDGKWRVYTRQELMNIVEERHSLQNLIKHIGKYIREGR